MTARDVWRWTDERGVQRLVGTDELRAALASNLLPASTLVWREGMGSWAPASTLPEFASAAFAAGGASSEIADEDSFDARSTLKEETHRATLVGLATPAADDPAAPPLPASAVVEALPHPVNVPASGQHPRPVVTQIPPFGAPPPAVAVPRAPAAPLVSQVPPAGGSKAPPKRKPMTSDIDGLWATTTQSDEDETIPRRARPSELAAAAAKAAEAAAARRSDRVTSRRPEPPKPEAKKAPHPPPLRTLPPGSRDGSPGGSDSSQPSIPTLKTPPRSIMKTSLGLGTARPPPMPSPRPIFQSGAPAPPVKPVVSSSPPSVRIKPPPLPGVNGEVSGESRTMAINPLLTTTLQGLAAPALPGDPPRMGQARQNTGVTATLVSATDAIARAEAELTGDPGAPARMKVAELLAEDPSRANTLIPKGLQPAPMNPAELLPPEEFASRRAAAAPDPAVSVPSEAAAAPPAPIGETLPLPGIKSAPAAPKSTETLPLPGMHRDPARSHPPRPPLKSRPPVIMEATPPPAVTPPPSAVLPLPPAATPLPPAATPLPPAAAPLPPAVTPPPSSVALTPPPSSVAPPSSAAPSSAAPLSRPSDVPVYTPRRGLVTVPVSSLLGAGGVLIGAVIGSFFVGRASTVPAAMMARPALGAVPVLARATLPPPLKPCWMVKQPAMWASKVAHRIPFEVAAAPGDSLALGYARDAKTAVGIEIRLATGEIKSRATDKKDDEVERVFPTPSGELRITRAGAAGPLQSPVAVTEGSPFTLGVAGGAIAVSAPPSAAPVKLWPITGDEGLDAASAHPAGDRGYLLVYRRARAVWGGFLDPDRKASGALVKVTGSGGSVGKPAAGWNGREVAVVFADRPSGDARYEIRLGHAPGAQVPAETKVWPLPKGGPGGDAFAPDIAGLSDGRWLIMWTEGASGSRAVRAQTLAPDFTPLGDPIALSPPAGNFGQGAVGLAGGYAATVFLSKGSSSYELWGAVLQCR